MRACHWITNIEEAVNYGAVLEVYYFVDHVGMGKVEGFSTAGHEHLRREELNSRRAEFRETDDFKAVLKAGLEGLSKRQRGDSSSPYSREENRLFLAISCMVAGRRSQVSASCRGLGKLSKGRSGLAGAQGLSLRRERCFAMVVHMPGGGSLGGSRANAGSHGAKACAGGQ